MFCICCLFCRHHYAFMQHVAVTPGSLDKHRRLIPAVLFPHCLILHTAGSEHTGPRHVGIKTIWTFGRFGWRGLRSITRHSIIVTHETDEWHGTMSWENDILKCLTSDEVCLQIMIAVANNEVEPYMEKCGYKGSVLYSLQQGSCGTHKYLHVMPDYL